ncbi:hypothetical protein AMECASPLE_000094 [Ameca splendens]|uniref:Uncharacterized protein n=1 Tax=Ameca splendens TaxID=208324 RepID=A0ABV0YVP5_9TELE
MYAKKHKSTPDDNTASKRSLKEPANWLTAAEQLDKLCDWPFFCSRNEGVNTAALIPSSQASRITSLSLSKEITLLIATS